MTPRLAIGLTLAAAVLGAGCTTLSNNDAVARVDDEELSSDELTELLVGPDGGAAPTDAALVRQAIGSWIGERLPTDSDPADAPALYAEGLLASGTLCARAMVTEIEADRDAAVSALEAGEPFVDVLTLYNVNPNLAQTGGDLGCGNVNDYASTGLLDLFVELSAANSVASDTLDDDPTVEVFVVSQFVPFDELEQEQVDVVTANLPPDLTGIDIHVDPRFGTFDAAAGVVPLG